MTERPEFSMADAAKRVLHILDAAPDDAGPDVRLIPSTCGHQCVASPATHALLDDETMEHIIYCLPCATKEIL